MMKINVTVETEELVDVPWPEGVPLPTTGDSVRLTHSGRVIEFVVDDRVFTVGADGGGGAAVPSILIRGHTQQAGSVTG